MTEPVWVPILPTDELGEGDTREACPQDAAIFLVRHGGHVTAFRNSCPHLGLELNWRPDRFLDLDGQFIQCATHGALFRIKDGYCVTGPCQGQALTPLPCQEADGQIWVALNCPESRKESET